MSYIPDHVQAAIDRLFQQYKGKTRIEGMISAFVTEIQNLEETYQDLLTKRGIELAVGDQLDLLGQIVGQEREGLEDAAYRIRIKIRIIQNLSQGEPERAIQVYKFLLNATFVVYWELYPASVCMMAGGDIPADQVALAYENIQKILPATVVLQYFGYFDETNPFSFSPSVSPGGGFGDLTDSSVGGKLGALYTL